MSKKSVSQLVTDIKAQLPELDAQLDAIEVGELPQELDGLWRIACESSKLLTVLVDEIPDDATDKEMVLHILFDLRTPLSNVIGALDGIIYLATQIEDFSAAFSSKALDQIHNVLADARWFMENFDQLAEWYKSH
jgi:hypothetical protein